MRSSDLSIQLFPFVLESSLPISFLCMWVAVPTQIYLVIYAHMEACYRLQKKPAVSKSINCVSVFAPIPKARVFVRVKICSLIINISKQKY